MDFKELHDWNVKPGEAIAIQQKIRKQVRIESFTKKVRLIAGADISYNRYSPVSYAAFVVLDAKTLEVVAEATAESRMDFPYIPGLLSFREVPSLLEAWQKLEVTPDVIVFDGQGIAHPRRLGIASHMGVVLDRPSIGCGKTLLCGHYEDLGEKAGSTSPLIDRGEQVGEALRTKNRTNPVFVSPGHRMDIESATRIILGCLGGYRIPEPTRQAHLLANRFRREAA